MYQQYRPQRFNILPVAVKNIMIINGLMFLMTLAFERMYRYDLSESLGLYLFTSEHFRPWQVLTHIFMHGSWGHLLSNMFMLWMFGNILENMWGPRRFIIYYLVTALGAATIHSLVNYYDYVEVRKYINPEDLRRIMSEGRDLLTSYRNYTDPNWSKMNMLLNIPTVGASGAVFGVLLAFGMLFPNTEIFLYFLFPIKAKYFVAFYGLLELYLGFQNNPGDNIAHFAHLGGMLFGYFMVKYWNKHNRRNFY